MAVQVLTERVPIPTDIHAEIEEIAAKTGRDLSDVAAEMLTEAVKMRRVPGIWFNNSGVWGRVPCMAGTGIKVYLVIQSYRAMNGDWEQLREAYHWLDEWQLRAALAYAEAYPEDIEPHLLTEEQEKALIEDLWSKYPATKPPWV